jgi:hypothetical protein
MAAPVNKISVGNVTLNVWENEVGRGNDKFTVQSVSIQKNYKKDDKWESSSSFKHNELPFVIMACQKALEDKYLKEEVNFLDD